MDNPIVSVVTSAYNSEYYISRTIESVINQTFTNFEFILVDDGSIDQTWNIIQNYSNQDNRIVALRNNIKLGVVGGLNRGLEVARGEFIARQDADDISLPGRLHAQLTFLQDNPDYGMVATRVNLIDPDGHPVDAQNPYTPVHDEEIQSALLDHMCLCGPTVMLRRAVFRKAGYFFSEGLDASEDYDLCLRLAEKAKIASIEEPLYLYRIHPNSASRMREYQQAVNKAIGLERAIYRRFGPRPNMDRLKVVANDYLWAAVLGFVYSELSGGKQNLERALSLYPPILNQAEPLATYINYRTPEPLEDGVMFTQTIFRDLLPVTPFLSRLRSRLLSSLYMTKVFTKAPVSEPHDVLRHLLAGLRNDPRWLLNRGVWSNLLKCLLHRRMWKSKTA